MSLVRPDGSYLDLQPGLAPIGAGSALTVPLTTTALAEVPDSRAGMASGVVSAAREVSGVFGIALLGAVLAHRQSEALRAGRDAPEAFTDGYTLGLRIAAGLVPADAVVTAGTLRRRGRHRAPGRAPFPVIGRRAGTLARGGARAREIVKRRMHRPTVFEQHCHRPLVESEASRSAEA